MTCREFWDLMPELEGAGQPLEHASECPRCATLLQQQRALAMGLQRVASQRHNLEAPARLEERLLEAFRAKMTPPLEVFTPRTAPATHGWLGWPAQVSFAAAVMVLAVFVLWRHPRQPVQPVAGSEAIASVDLDSDFIPLPYAGEAGSAEDANLIRVEMPRSALMALGVPVADGEAGEPVEAEVLLGMGGAPQAVRILQ
jgi:hypothetical protein